MEPEEYERFPSFWSDATLRRWNLWGYVDARDVAQSCRLALEADVGAEQFIVAAADTVMNRPSAELMAEVYPSVAIALSREVRHAPVDREGTQTPQLRARVVLARPDRRLKRASVAPTAV
jgi:nucleoside-diphosphate-sugar epimerase